MPGRNQAPQYTYTLSAHPYIKPTALQSPAQKAPSPCGGGLGWSSSAYLAAQSPTAFPPSPAQRDRDGEGVSGAVYERMSAFFAFAALTPTPLPEGEGLVRRIVNTP